MLVFAVAAVGTGLVGTVVPQLPGLPLIWIAVLVWAAVENTAPAWAVLGGATVLAVAHHVLQNLLGGVRPADLVAPWRSLLVAVTTGLVGLLLARTLGLVAGFVGGLYLAERRRLRRGPSRPPERRLRREPARRERVIEALTGALIAGAWLVAAIG